MGWRGKRRTRKDNVRLRQVDFQIRFLHSKVCNYEGTKAQNRIEFEGKKIRGKD